MQALYARIAHFALQGRALAAQGAALCLCTNIPSEKDDAHALGACADQKAKLIPDIAILNALKDNNENPEAAFNQLEEESQRKSTYARPRCMRLTLHFAALGMNLRHSVVQALSGQRSRRRTKRKTAVRAVATRCTMPR